MHGQKALKKEITLLYKYINAIRNTQAALKTRSDIYLEKT